MDEWKVYTAFLPNATKHRDNFGYPDVAWTTILRRILNKCDVKIFPEFRWFRIHGSGACYCENGNKTTGLIFCSRVEQLSASAVLSSYFASSTLHLYLLLKAHPWLTSAFCHWFSSIFYSINEHSCILFYETGFNTLIYIYLLPFGFNKFGIHVP
jgi:hypothetical protein